MLLDRREGLAQAFKEETEKTKEPQKNSVLVACENLIEAVKLYQAGIKKGYGRKTKDNKFWKSVVAKALGVSRLYPARWNEVCEKVQQMGLQIVVQESSGREYWNYQEEPNMIEAFLGMNEEEEAPQVIKPRVEHVSEKDGALRAKAQEEGSLIIEGSCLSCGSLHCELYPDSRELFRCNGCNDLHESESEKLFLKKYEESCPQLKAHS